MELVCIGRGSCCTRLLLLQCFLCCFEVELVDEKGLFPPPEFLSALFCSHLLLIVAGAASDLHNPAATLLRGGGIRDAQLRHGELHADHVTLAPSD